MKYHSQVLTKAYQTLMEAACAEDRRRQSADPGDVQAQEQALDNLEGLSRAHDTLSRAIRVTLTAEARHE